MRARWFILFLVIVAVTLPRVLPFSPLFLTSDEIQIGRWTTQMSNALLAGDWAHTVNNAYPAVTLMWLETAQIVPGQILTGVSMVADDEQSVFASLPRRRLELGLVNSVVVVAGFVLLRRLFNPFVAFTATILIAFDPFILSQVRVFRTEGLNAGLMLVSALPLLLYVKEKRREWLLWSSLLGGWAVLTRFNSMYLLAFAGFSMTLGRLWWGERQLWGFVKGIIGDTVLWAAGMSLTVFICWPALWVSPVAAAEVVFNYLRKATVGEGVIWGNSGVFFRGQIVDGDPGVLFYLWSLAYRTTPQVWLGVIAAVLVGLALLWTRLPHTPRFVADKWSALEPYVLPSLLMSAYVVFYVAAMSLGVSKIDRYLLPVFPGLSIVAAAGLGGLVEVLFKSKRAIEIGLSGALLVGSVWLATLHHPYYATYWNPLLGGGSGAWQNLPIGIGGVGIDRLVARLNALPNAPQIRLSGPRNQLYCPFIFKGTCLSETNFLNGDYFITHAQVLQNKRTPFADIRPFMADVELVDTYTNDGVDYAYLYKLPAGFQPADQWLSTHGKLVGYRLPAQAVSAGDAVTVSIFWLNGDQGWTLADSEFFVKVLDKTGQVQQIIPAQLNEPFIPVLAQQREMLMFTARFSLPPDIAPDIYTLALGLRLKVTGEETWNFTLTNLAHTITVNRGMMGLNPANLPMQHRLGQPVGDTGLTLLGYNEFIQSDTPRLEFYWQAQSFLSENYEVNLTLLDPSGHTMAAWRAPLAPEIHPLTSWQPGEVVKVPFYLKNVGALPPMAYRPVLSIWRADASEAKPIAQISLLP